MKKALLSSCPSFSSHIVIFFLQTVLISPIFCVFLFLFAHFLYSFFILCPSFTSSFYIFLSILPFYLNNTSFPPSCPQILLPFLLLLLLHPFFLFITSVSCHISVTAILVPYSFSLYISSSLLLHHITPQLFFHF